jgi:hypothetical protein
VPESDWPEAEAQRRVVLADFDAAGDYGDRRQVIQTSNTSQPAARNW